ncbi:HTH-type transcriptional regulator BetI [mine drainage metagenome]|uniref:HTH-type transcriptional regulator BetI n=1 Tax=mine drainage metagenome TaxID=410659 RepID=A0A1J5P864_9ZZZZ
MADGVRRKFRREGEAQRQGDLIAAALELIAEGGPQAATVRAIAARAGVTPGLIRHYFHTKEDLLCAAYASFMQRMTDDHRATVADGVADPVARLARFVVASLTPPMVDARAVGLWAGFIHLVQHDPVMRAVHHKTYHAFRFELDVLIAEALASVGRGDSPEELRRHAISCNALIDGLWMEGSSLPDAFSDGELPRLGVANIGLLLGLDLAAALED